MVFPTAIGLMERCVLITTNSVLSGARAPMSLVLVCRSITAARQSQPQQAGNPGVLFIGRMTDVAVGDLRYTFGTFPVICGMPASGGL
jgi:hypothetical protein